MTLVKFNSDKKNNALMPGFNDVFESVFNDTFFNDRMVSRVPAVNVSESSDRYHIELAAPGLEKQDFKIKIDDSILTISVEKQESYGDKDRKFNKREFVYTSFVRSFTLPEMAEHEQVEASYANGILNIEIPKKEEAKTISREIEIK